LIDTQWFAIQARIASEHVAESSKSLIDIGLRIYDRDAEVGKEQGLSRSLFFANGLRFS
jgi:hypothetical protein